MKKARNNVIALERKAERSEEVYSEHFKFLPIYDP